MNKTKIVRLKESDLVRIVKRILSEQTETTPPTSTENTKKLSDINPTIFGSSDNLRADARMISSDVILGISALRLFQDISKKIYNSNKDKESTTQVLYMGDKKNPSGERLKSLIGGDNYTIDPGRAAKENFGAVTYTYGELKKAMGKNDQGMAILYNKWLDTKIKA